MNAKRKTGPIKFWILLLGSNMAFSAAAYANVEPEMVRQTFAKSGDSKLELAAEALGDESLLKVLQKILENPRERPELIKKLKDLGLIQ